VTAPRALLVGLDACDPDLLERWAAEGALPTVARLLRAGLRTATVNPVGLYVGAIWPFFATGLAPARHGRYCFRQLVPGSYAEQFVTPASIAAEPFWAARSRAGRRVAVVDVPKMPLYPTTNGIQVVDWGSHDLDHDPPLSASAPLARELHRRYGHDPVGSCDAHDGSAASLAALGRRLEKRIAVKTEIVLDMLARERWDLAVAVFGDAHCAGHQLWHLHDPGHPRHDPAVAAHLGDPLRRVYVALDAALGCLLAAAGDDCTRIVLASHGMGPHYDGSHLLDEVLARLDGSDGRARRAAGVLPAARRLWRLLPAPAAARLRPLRRRLVAPVESALLAARRRGRRCFAVPNNEAWGAVRVNLVGREPAGVVRRGAEMDVLLDEISGALAELVNPATGRPVVTAIVRTDDVHRGPARDALPDLLVEWNREAPIAAVSSPRVGTVRGSYDGPRTGDHRPAGMLLAEGPGVVPGGTARPVAIEDLAPTLARLVGVTLAGVDGRPVPEIAG
jgi:predicted AlkP superfamily phosphohydrolase/phosphomutase